MYFQKAGVSGWSAAGWTTDAGGYSATIANGATVTLSSNATYYSLYTSIITVTYYNYSSSPSYSYGTRIVNFHNGTSYSDPAFTLWQIGVTNWAARGWSTSNTGNAGITYNNGSTFYRDSNITLYSLYYRTVTISYNGNGNTGGSMGTSTGTAYLNAFGSGINASIAVAGNGFSRTNYKFRYWTINSTSGSVYYVNSTYNSTSDCTMYASWIIAVVNFNYTGGIQTFTAYAGVTYLLEVYGGNEGGWYNGGSAETRCWWDSDEGGMCYCTSAGGGSGYIGGVSNGSMTNGANVAPNIHGRACITIAS